MSAPKQNEKKRVADAYTDLLTGVRSRNGMVVDFEKPHRFPLGIIVADINGTLSVMKEENGFEKADRMIVDLTGTIRKILPDAVCYRLGGDLFSVVCEHVTREAFYYNLLVLQEALRKKESKRGRGLSYRVSLGSCFAQTKRSLLSVNYDATQDMYRSKQLMYRAKGSEGSRYRSVQDKVLEFMREGEMRRQIREGRFLVYYQPQVSFSGGEIIGAEALIRYANDDGSIRFPVEFIPSLESARRISELDFYVFERVCKKIREWSRKYKKKICISTNFSRYTITEKGFVERLCEIRDKYGICPDQVEVEITETVETDENGVLRRTTKTLHEKGFLIAIDDFGVSHSNLSLLTDVDFDVLKFDKSVIDMLYSRGSGGKVERHNKTVLLLSSLIGVCHQMNIRTIAEGVEEKEQSDILDILNCDVAQGYYYSRPVSESAFEKLLR